MRLQVFLSHNGVCSRREALVLVQSGVVSVDGKMIKEPSFDVLGHERITVRGKVIKPNKYQYLMIYKPVGVTTTKEDVYAEKTVMELLPNEWQHLNPVGRLDKDSEGLLLLTNDGQLAFDLTHPSKEHEKTYEVTVHGQLTREKAQQLEQGIMIDHQKTLPCRISHLRYNAPHTQLTIILKEGRKRQLRRMMAAMDCRVDVLKRTAIGALSLGKLQPGEWRLLTSEELTKLRNNRK